MALAEGLDVQDGIVGKLQQVPESSRILRVDILYKYIRFKLSYF